MKSIPSSSGTRYPLVAGMLAAVVLLLLVGGWFAGQHFRGSVGIDGVPAMSSSSAPAVSPSTVAAPPAVKAASPALPSAATSPQANAPRVATSPAEQQIEQAYLHYWDVYSGALFNLDASAASQVAAGAEVQRIQDEVDSFRRKGDAVRVVVQHHYLIFDVTDTDAKVYDEIQNGSFSVDPLTKQPPQGSDATDLERDTFFFHRIDGAWKVERRTRGA